MKPSRSDLYSFVAVGFLTVLTLGTFYLLRNYGPESAVSIFTKGAVQLERHLAEARQLGEGKITQQLSSELEQDTRAIALASVQPVQSAPVQRLVEIVASYPGGKSQVMSKVGNSEKAIILISYFGVIGEHELYWVVDKTEAGWQINSEETLLRSGAYQSSP